MVSLRCDLGVMTRKIRKINAHLLVVIMPLDFSDEHCDNVIIDVIDDTVCALYATLYRRKMQKQVRRF